jgi:hypothetical protein
MDFQEKVLYHQIHPLKLATDIGTTFPSLYLLWRHKLVPALVLTLVPPVIVSAALICWADLEKYKQSAFGVYVGQYMTPAAQATRLAGFGVMAVGSWYHRMWVIAVGLLVVLSGWVWGVLRDLLPKT